MKIQIKTKVGASLNQVKQGFTEDLFLSLNPPFPPVKLIQFDGCKKGDKVQLELDFIFFKQLWTSDIIDDKLGHKSWYFLDVGTKLPFFLRKWRHYHGVVKVESGSVILDDITFSTGMILMDILIYPLLYGQFLYRKPIYKRIFKSN